MANYDYSSKPYGYWQVGSKNGLEGGPSTIDYLPDGTPYIKKYPGLPAVLEDEFILQAIQTTPAARTWWDRLYPDLDPISQQRLAELVRKAGVRSTLVSCSQDLNDALQRKQVRASVAALSEDD